MANTWGNNGNSERLFPWAPKSLQMVIAAMKLKDSFLGRKVMTNLDSILKSRDITLLTKVHLVKALVFPIVMYGCESWTIKNTENQWTDSFALWCWRRLLRVPWTTRRSNQSILKDMCAHMCQLLSHVQLCDPMDYSPPGSSVQETLQARALEWIAWPSSNLPNPEIKPPSPALANRFFTTGTAWEALNINVKMNKRDPFIWSPVSNVLLKYCYPSIKQQKHFQLKYQFVSGRTYNFTVIISSRILSFIF